MKRMVLFIGAFIIISLLAPGRTSDAATGGAPHLPDLKTAPPSDLRVSYSGGSKVIQFSNIVYNAGNGPLELRPVNSRSARKTTVYQVIYTHDGAGRWTVAQEREAGGYTFHKSHDHWHFENFANYQLVAENQGVLPRTGSKTTFCIIDNVSPTKISGWDPAVLNLQHRASSATYTSCGRSDRTGMSVGWGDKYGYWLSGQSINASGLPDGLYTLRSTADPGGRLLETYDANNAGEVRFELRGDTITLR